MKLNYKRTVLTGLAFMSISVFWQMYDNIIPLILKFTFGLGETITGVVMALDNVLALLLLPVFGALSDKLVSPLGKRTPFIIVGTLFAIIFTLLLPIADNSKNFFMFFVALGGVLLSVSVYRSPAVALMPDLTPRPLRSMANAIINLMGSIGGIIALVMIMFLVPEVEQPNYFPLFMGVAIIMALCVITLVLTIRENKMAIHEEPLEVKEKGGTLDPATRRSFFFLLASVFFWFFAYNATVTAFSRYAVEVWGFEGGGFAGALLVAYGAAMLTFIPIGHLSSRIGRKKTILIGVATIATSYLIGSFLLNPTVFIYGVFALKGIGWAMINVNSFPMVVEMGKNADTGKYTGYYYSASMSAQILTPIVSGALLEHVSYYTLFPYAFSFAIIALITMTQVKHGDVKPTDISLEHVIPED